MLIDDNVFNDDGDDHDGQDSFDAILAQAKEGRYNPAFSASFLSEFPPSDNLRLSDESWLLLMIMSRP